ncbi:MAG: type II toxin-antitoxin system RelE/ParE family toxin [Candidatus Ornithomonoglobus sp.]
MDNIIIEYSKSAKKSIKALNEPFKSNIREAIENFPQGDIKKLQGYTNMYRMRVGNYRIIYKTTLHGIFIEDILPRGKAYKRLREVF